MNSFDFLQEMLLEGVQEGSFPSAAAAVGRGDEILFAGTAGGALRDTRFDMASMSKVMGPTMLALRALEDGMLTLADPLSLFFDAPEDKAGITVFQLMTHTAGFTPAFFLWDEIKNPADAAACILRRPLEFAPGDAPHYSCMGYILLGKVLETVYGAPLHILAHERVFAPLGMEHTGYCPTGGNIAPTERDPETGVALCGVVHDENARFLGGISGNAGVFSTLDDCIRFASMLAMGGNGFLSPATLRKAIKNYTPGKEQHRGLGFHLGGTQGSFMGDLFPDNAFGHTGFTGTSLVVSPGDGLYAVLLTNSVNIRRQNEKLFRFRRRFHNKIYGFDARRAK